MNGCAATRGRLAQGRADGDVTAHLRGCEECRTHADGLEAVRHHLSRLVPAPPADLEAAVREEVGLPPSGAGVAPHRWRRLVRRTPAGVAAAVAGALLGVVVVAALTTSPETDGAASRLEAVAASHAGHGTSVAFDLAGEVALQLPERRTESPVTPGQRTLFTELDRLTGGGADPAATRVLVEYRAQGEADGRGALAYELRWRAEAGASVEGVLEVVTVDERTWVRAATGSGWVRAEHGAGFDLGVIRAPHHLGEVLATLDDVEEAGLIETVEVAGESVEHLRARTARGLVVDVWTGREDGRVRRLRWLPPPPADERDGTSHGETIARLRDHGRARFIGVPGEGRDPDGLDDEQRPAFLPTDG